MSLEPWMRKNWRPLSSLTLFLLGYISRLYGKLTTLTYRPPPLLSRDSHTGYLPSSSPLITTTTVDNGHFEVPSTSIAPAETIDISPKASPALQVSPSTS